MHSPDIHLCADVEVVGAGVAGLWTAHALLAAGFRVVVSSVGAIGEGQTLASQGIIHGGIKYALTGAASAASKAIAEMPSVWAACLRGEPGASHIDLRSVRVLSQQQHLWTTTGIGAKLVGVVASKAVRTPMTALDVRQRPEGFSGAPAGVNMYSIREVVLDPHSLVETLARPLVVADPRHVHIRAEWRVLCAGAGNPEHLTQRRPLHMVMVRASNLPRVFGHCVSGGLSDKPRLTITSQVDAAGRGVWYIGGQLAEGGVNRSRDEQIAEARRELMACIGWVDLASAEWATLRVDRAESREPSGRRPDLPVITRVADRELALWPTKLAFAPLGAGMVVSQLQRCGAKPADGSGVGGVPTGVVVPPAFRPPLGQLPWEKSGVIWT